MNVATAIAEILKREGVEFLSCYPNQPLIEACAVAGIRPILCRQERVGVGIVDGFARATNGRRMAAFAMQHGPGTENAFPGAAQAYSDNVPILMLPGGEDTHTAGIRPNFSAIEAYAPVTKWLAQVNHADRTEELMRRAFYHLRTGKGGPVLLEIPRDVWTAEIPGELTYTPVKGNRTSADPEDVRTVAQVLVRAKNLVIHAGQGVMFAEATADLVELAELLGAPVMTTLPGKSAFPENHPLALGASATSTTKPISHFLQKADVVFGIGTSFTRTNYGKTIPTGKVMVHSTVDASDVNKDYRADYAVLGDAQLVLQALIAEIRWIGPTPNPAVVTELASVKREWLAEWMPQLTSTETPLNQYRLIWDLMHH
ncbi:MAG: hypothetical protein EXR52_08390, partial [Dehalococcoidia bacterium]|nr:hypothetical protein [Dehalococcoidia bacterium]